MKVRIKKAVQPGDQRDFALVTGQESAATNTSVVTPSVKHTMGAIPREYANAELEGGEVYVGDSNMDGYLEHMSVVGPKHGQGGVPMNLTPGTFVYSDASNLTIKDKKLLKNNFNYSGKTATPAAVAKKFKLNDYMNTLQKGEADPIGMNTAQLMVDTHTKKLGELAMVQEAMKGFPNGIPAIAEMAVGPDQELPQGRNGGLVKFNNGGQLRKPHYWESEPVLKIEDARIIYQKALKSGDPEQMIKASELIHSSKDSPWYSLQVVPWSDENEFETMKHQLVEKAKGVHAQKAYQSNIKPLTDKMSKMSELIKAQREQVINNMTTGDIAQNRNKLAEIQKFQELEKKYQHIIKNENAPKAGAGNSNSNLYENSISKYSSEYGKAEIQKMMSDLSRFEQMFDPSYVAPKPKKTPGASEELTKEQIEGREAFLRSSQPKAPVPQQEKEAAPKVTQSKQAPAPKKSNEPDFSKMVTIGEYEEGGAIPQFNDGAETTAPVKKTPKTELKRDPNTGAFYVLSKTTGKPIFNTYLSDAPTPGGVASGFGKVSDQDFTSFYTGWMEQLGVDPDEIKGAKDFQSRMYTHYLENNPDELANVWSTVGLNRSALGDSDLTARLMSMGVLDPSKGNKLNFANVSPEDKKKILGDLTGHYADGYIGVRSLGLKPPTPVTKPAEAPAVAQTNQPAQDSPLQVDPVKVENLKAAAQAETDTTPSTPNVRKNGPWYLQDIVNLGVAASDPINRYEPMLSQLDFETVDPVFRDPSRMIAANQSQQASYQDMVSNSMDPAVAAAVMMGANGQAFEQVANGISEVESQNAVIGNQVAAQNAQTRNQVTQANAELLQRYVGETAMLNQNIDNAKSLKKARVNAAWNNGMNNWYRKKAMEQVLFPQTYQNPITGDWEFSGVGQNLTGYNTYSGTGAQTAAQAAALRDLQLEQNLTLLKKYEAAGYTPAQIEAASKLGMGSSRTSTEFNDRMAMLQMMGLGSTPYLPQ